MSSDKRILLDFRGGPRDGSRKDLGDSTGGTWPAEYVHRRWPVNADGLIDAGPVVGRYRRTDEWDERVEARVYVWEPDPEADGRL